MIKFPFNAVPVNFSRSDIWEEKEGMVMMDIEKMDPNGGKR